MDVLGGMADTTTSLLVLRVSGSGGSRVSLLDDARGNTGSPRPNAAGLDLFHRSVLLTVGALWLALLSPLARW